MCVWAQFLGKVMSSSGCLLASPSFASFSGVETSCSLLSENSVGSMGLIEGGCMQGGEETPGVSPLLPQHPTAGSAATLAPLSESSSKENIGFKPKAEETPEETLPSPPITEDIWLHMPKTKPICIKEFSLNGRLPARRVCL